MFYPSDGGVGGELSSRLLFPQLVVFVVQILKEGERERDRETERQRERESERERERERE